MSNIPIYVLEDLSLADVNDLVEKGVIFDVTSNHKGEASLLPRSTGLSERDKYWSNGDIDT